MTVIFVANQDSYSKTYVNSHPGCIKWTTMKLTWFASFATHSRAPFSVPLYSPKSGESDSPE